MILRSSLKTSGLPIAIEQRADNLSEAEKHKRDFQEHLGSQRSRYCSNKSLLLASKEHIRQISDHCGAPNTRRKRPLLAASFHERGERGGSFGMTHSTSRYFEHENHDDEDNIKGLKLSLKLLKNGGSSEFSHISEASCFGGEYYYDNIAFETCPAVADFYRNSWTIRVLGHEHAGDTLWFRMFRNGKRGEYIDLEDDEILFFVQAVVDVDEHYSFYVKVDESNQVALFEPEVILSILRLLLKQAKVRDGLIIPSFFDGEQEAHENSQMTQTRGRMFWPLSSTLVQEYVRPKVEI